MIYDCFLFFDELDVLELRLNVLAEVVDRFVIVEAAQTFSGNSKPLNLRENWGRFEAFHNRITYIELGDLAPDRCVDHESWSRQAFQRDAIFQGLAGCTESDWLIVSDCDEIPSPEAVLSFLPSLGITRLKQRTYYYSFNWLLDYGSDPASRSRIGTFSDLIRVKGAENFRNYLRDDPCCPVIEAGGWHCSYFGGDLDRIKLKTASFSHYYEYTIGSDSELIFDIATGKDLHHRERSGVPQQLTWAPIGEGLPRYFLENRARFAHFTTQGFIDRYVLG